MLHPPKTNFQIPDVVRKTLEDASLMCAEGEERSVGEVVDLDGEGVGVVEELESFGAELVGG